MVIFFKKNIILFIFLCGCSVRKFNIEYTKLCNRIPTTPIFLFPKHYFNGEVGYCMRGKQGAYIALNQNRFNKLGWHQQRSVVLHELGHCEIDLDHSMDEINHMYYTMQTEKLIVDNEKTMDDIYKKDCDNF